MTFRVDPRTMDSYRASCLAICAARLSGFVSLDQIAVAADRLNAYPDLAGLEEPRQVVTLDPAALAEADLARAEACLLEGRFLAEHAAAGEATRLKLGTKYLINPKRRLTLDQMARSWAEETKAEVTPSQVLAKNGGTRPEELLDLSLGQRHMLQIAFDLARLALVRGREPQAVLARQWTLVILNQASAEDILAEFSQANFYGFDPQRVLFLVQESFRGINLRDGRFFFDPAAPKRLHNHGQMAMQATAEDQVFSLAGGRSEVRRYLRPEEVEAVLGRMEDKLSYSIEDLAYLTGALDLPALALALRLSDQGFRMVMEIVANDPDKPIKGGLAAWDPNLGRNVMIESFQLAGLPNSEIRYLNRNFNHYPRPQAAFQALAAGLPMPLAVKDGFLYFQPVQGDLNFLLPTAFVQRKLLSPISAWKSAANSPAAVAAMAAQDRQPGFREFAGDVLKRRV